MSLLANENKMTQTKESVKPATGKKKPADVVNLVNEENETNADMIEACAIKRKKGHHRYVTRANGDVSCDCGRLLSINPERRKEFEAECKEFNEKMEAAKKQSEEAAKERGENPQDPQEGSWINAIDYREMWWILGRDGVYNACSEMSKGGMVVMQEFLDADSRKRSYHKDFLVRFSDLVFIQNEIGDDSEPKKLRMADVFTNIDNNFVTVDEMFVPIGQEDPDVLEILVPDYNPNKFKMGHAKRVWQWFNIIKEKVTEEIDKHNQEEETEEKNESK